MQIAFLGLGKMGSRMASKLVADGHELIVWNRTKETAEEFVAHYPKGSTLATTVEEALSALTGSPKIVWLMLPAGDATEAMITEVMPLLAKGDVLIDGGNARFSDTERRSQMLSEKGILFLGIGVSGGIIAATEGYPMMAGGDKAAYDIIVPLLDTLAKPHGGHDYFGTGGAGHFVKMVHNGIEYGMMQAFAEGFAVLEKSDYHFDLHKISRLWQKGTIVSSFLLDRAEEMLANDTSLASFTGVVTESGEGKWTVEEAKKEGVQTPIIEGSLQYRWETKEDTAKQQSYVSRMLNALRNAFGGHEVKK